MKKIKRIGVLCLMLLALNINATAQETDTQPSDSTTQPGFENTYVRVTQGTGESSMVIYTGPLGGYDNGRWSDVDFGEICHLTIINFDNLDEAPIFITRASQPQPDATMYSGRNLLDTADLSVETNIKLNGIKVNENRLSIISNTDINCNFAITNNSDEGKSFTGILATYTDVGTLYQIRTVEKWIDSGEASDIDIEYKFESENEQSARLMLWDGFSGMLPLRASIQLSENNGMNVFYYDANNRLIQLDKMNGVSLVYAYDNNGNLLSKTVVREGE